MTITLSSAAAAAKAAKADLTAPVAANNGQQENLADSRAQVKQPARNNSNTTSSAAPAKQAPAPAPARATPPAQNAQAGKAASGSQATQRTDDSADDVKLATPLFSQLLNLAVLPETGEDGDGATGEGKDAEAEGIAAIPLGDVLPAMQSGIITPPITPVDVSAQGAAPRADAVSAVSTLNPSATRLNLAAAGVAVTAAPPAASTEAADAAAAAAAQAAAALASAAQTAASQGVYSQAANAALAAQARQVKTDAPADADVAAQPAAPAAAPVAAAPLPAAAPVVAAAPRAPVLAADTKADVTTAAPAAGATVAKDEGRSTATTTVTGTTANVGFATAAPATTPAAATVKLAGTPEQWQQPLREALGDRLQLQLQRNNDHAVIRLEPPNMGSIEISIRHSAGALTVNLSANNSEVVRQLNTIGDSVRQDLSTRSFSDVAVTVSSSRAQSQAQSDGSGGRSGQQRNQDDGRTPGRALSDDETTSTFAMNERE